MMTYFEVKERLENLEQFREMYRQYIGFTNRESNVPAETIRQKLEPMAVMTVDSLKRVGLGATLTKDAPKRGGRTIRINLIKAIFRDRVRRHFSLDDREPLKILDRGILEYRSLLWKVRLQLFNPVFWLYESVSFLAQLPLLIFRKSGYDTSHAETLTSVRVYLILVQIVVYALLIKWSGVFDWIRIDILAL